jgi:hypothetical protein
MAARKLCVSVRRAERRRLKCLFFIQVAPFNAVKLHTHTYSGRYFRPFDCPSVDIFPESIKKDSRPLHIFFSFRFYLQVSTEKEKNSLSLVFLCDKRGQERSSSIFPYFHSQLSGIVICLSLQASEL